MSSNTVRWLVAATLFLALRLAAPGSLLAQEAERDCRVPKEPNGLIRGDRVPSGCVLETDYRAPHDSLSDWSWPYIACNERLFYTPTVKRSVLANCVALSRGGLIIPTVPFAGFYVPGNFGSIGPSDRHFGSPQRNFGSAQRHFGSTQRNFGSAGRSSGEG